MSPSIVARKRFSGRSPVSANNPAMRNFFPALTVNDDSSDDVGHNVRSATLYRPDEFTASVIVVL